MLLQFALLILHLQVIDDFLEGLQNRLDDADRLRLYLNCTRSSRRWDFILINSIVHRILNCPLFVCLFFLLTDFASVCFQFLWQRMLKGWYDMLKNCLLKPGNSYMPQYGVQLKSKLTQNSILNPQSSKLLLIKF